MRRPRRLGIGVVAQRVGAEPIQDSRCSSLSSNSHVFGPFRSTVLRLPSNRTRTAPRRRGWAVVRTVFPEQAEMNVKDGRIREVVEQVLARRFDSVELTAAELFRVVFEPALRAGDRQTIAGQRRVLVAHESMNGVPLWHAELYGGRHWEWTHLTDEPDSLAWHVISL